EVPRGMSAEGAGLVGTGLLLGDEGFLGDLSAAAAKFPAPEWAMSRLMRSLESTWQALAPERSVRPPTVDCRVLRVDGPLVVLELEVRIDGFTIEEGTILVMSSTGPIGAELVPGESSPLGSHGKGLVVRVALRRVDGGAWPHGDTCFAHWKAERLVELHFELP